MTKNYLFLKSKEIGVAFGWAVRKRKDFLSEELSNLKAKYAEMLNQAQEAISNNSDRPELEKEMWNMVLLPLKEQIKTYDLELKELVKINFNENPENNLSIEEARLVPIERFLGKPLREQGDKQWYSSPLRDDGRTPSFCVSKSKNLYFDFVLGEGGDAIKLYSKINNCNFVQAVKELMKYR